MRRLLILLTFSISAPAAAQQQDAQAWLQVNAVLPLAPKLRVTLVQIARASDRQGGVFQTEFGGLLGYRPVSGVELDFGYGAVGAYRGNRAADEDRLRQQVVLTAGRLTGRLRVDERFSHAGGAVGFRVRPLIRYNQPVGGGVGLFVSHESFFLPNDTEWGQHRGYERMRNIVGVALPPVTMGSGYVFAELGYLNQYRFGREGTRAEIDHTLNLQLTFDFARHPAAHVND